MRPHLEDGVVPPARDEDVVLEDGDGVEVLDGRAAEDGAPVAAVVVCSIKVHP